MPNQGEVPIPRRGIPGGGPTERGIVYDPFDSFRGARRDTAFGMPDSNNPDLVQTAEGGVSLDRYVFRMLQQADDLSKHDVKQLGRVDRAKLQVAARLKQLQGNSEQRGVMLDLCNLFEEKLGGESIRYAIPEDANGRFLAVSNKCAEIDRTLPPGKNQPNPLTSTTDATAATTQAGYNSEAGVVQGTTDATANRMATTITGESPSQGIATQRPDNTANVRLRTVGALVCAAPATGAGKLEGNRSAASPSHIRLQP
jgi:hypothetical protein